MIDKQNIAHKFEGKGEYDIVSTFSVNLNRWAAFSLNAAMLKPISEFLINKWRIIHCSLRSNFFACQKACLLSLWHTLLLKYAN